MKFSDLTENVQGELIKRFNWHAIDANEAFQSHMKKFENNNLDPSNFLKLSEDDQLTLFHSDFKEISHIKSVKNHPDLESDPSNVIFEDKTLNRRRVGRDMTDEEEKAGLEDFIEDIHDGDINEDGIIDLESALNEAENHDAIFDLIGLALPIGLVMSAILVVKKVKNKEIVLNDAPKEYVFKVGERSVKVASVGILLASGSPVLIGGTSALIIYKSRGFIENISKGIYNVLTHETIKKVASKSGRVVIETGKFTGKTLIYSAKGAYTVATHEKTKKSINFAAKALAKTSSISAKIISRSAKGAYKVVTHETTKKTVKKAGTGLLATTRAGAKGIKASVRGIKSLYVKLKKKKKNV
jgi:hypothetical protein